MTQSPTLLMLILKEPLPWKLTPFPQILWVVILPSGHWKLEMNQSLMNPLKVLGVLLGMLRWVLRMEWIRAVRLR